MNKTFIKTLSFTLAAVVVASCGDNQHLKQETPTRLYTDYDENRENAAVIGVGEPISKRRMNANATLKVTGYRSLEDVVRRVANTYNLAVRYGDGVRKSLGREIIIAELTFDEARNYIEDVYGVQIVREGERRILILPSIDEPRIDKFEPGTNVSLSQFVRGLARQCDYNLVITENKKALSTTFVTASFEDITCRDAFDAVLAPHGLALVDEGDHYALGGFPTKRWVLNLYEPRRNETQTLSFSSTVSGEGDSASASSGGSGNIETTFERNLWAELKSDLEELIAKTCNEYMDTVSSEEGESATSDMTGDCGYVRINPTVGLVQMKAPQGILNSAEEIIRRVEDVASRRLLVEARIIAVSKDHSYEKGGNLGLKDEDNKLALQTYGGTQNVTVSSLLSNAVLSGFSSETSFGGSAGIFTENLDAAVRFAESFGTTYQLMQPTMEVMDRQRAVMIDGRNEVYFIGEREEDTSDDPDVGDTITYEDKYQFVGIQFSVVAQVGEEGEPHTLAVQVPITDIERFVPNPDASVSSEVPVVTTRIIDQKVRIRDGEVKVIGGLTRKTAVDKDSGIPVLRQAPVTGNFFDEEEITYQDLEFIVLLQVRRLY